MSAKNLVIVESPAKAKTINKYLGRDYVVKASMGHVRDLPSTGLCVDIKNDFEPTYEVSPKKKQVVAELKKAAEFAETVFLAPDPDREGEAIAWHLRELLAKGKKDHKRFRRVAFNEITKNAVQQAFLQPGDIEMSRVDSQQARRVLDRIVGYQISPLLWRRVRGARSAGRVQSVAVRLIVDREREIRAFVPKEYWSVEAELRKLVDPRMPFHTRLVRINDDKLIDVEKGLFLLGNQGAADAAKAELEGAAWKVEKVDEQPRKRNPFPPFMTSTLQRAASTNLRLGTDQTMRIAQQLYEGVDVGAEGSVGLITYMRTDSLTVSRDAQAETLAYIREAFGAEYAPETPNFYRSRETAQGAHEAIRPTSVRRTPESVAQYLDRQQLALYTLIWKRFVASQMAPAQLLVKSVDILARNERVVTPRNFWFRASTTQVTFPGFLKVHGVEEGDEDKMAEEVGEAIPPLTAAEMLELLNLKQEQHFTEPPPRYSEATLIKVLEELGIGRPSTYAPTISTIQKREYVEKDKGRLKPTELGETTIDLLVKWFPDLLDVKFTAQMEEQLDEVESGKIEWHELLKRFYKDFKPALAKANETRKPEKTSLKCQDCGAPMVIKHGRNGEFLTCSKYPKCKNAGDFTRDEAGAIHIKELEKLHILCEKCGQPMTVRNAPTGEFLACSEYPKCKNTMNFTRGEDGEIHAKVPEKTGAVCPKCGEPMIVKSGKTGEFLACSAYPKCKSTLNFTRDATGVIVPEKKEATGIKCEKCGSDMVIKSSRRGPFLACPGYPKCRNAMSFTRDESGKFIPKPRAESLIKVDEKCDKCGAPMAIKSMRRVSFLACTAYPKCKNTKPMSDKLKEELAAVRATIAASQPQTEAAPASRPKPVLTKIECEKCGQPMAIRQGPRGQFLGCTGYPKCRNAKPVPANVELAPESPTAETTAHGPVEATAEQLKQKKAAAIAPVAEPAATANPQLPATTNEKCEKCGEPMTIRSGRFGPFLACSAYPKCKTTKKIPPLTA
ncbi:MAG: type I DNA topoisomerase [Verrucomicrobiia bacterium]